MSSLSAGVVGLGKWGEALVSLMERNGVDVKKYSRRAEARTCDITDLEKLDVLMLSIGSTDVMDFLVKNEKYLPNNICICSKGVILDESYSDFLFSSICKEKFPSKNFSFLFGPSFSDEILKGEKTIVTVASGDIGCFENIKKCVYNKDFFEVEYTDEVELVECFGVFKNIIAITSGILSACSVGVNFRSRVVLKMIQELCAIGGVINQNSYKVFTMSCGFGDIFLSATSDKSRNFRYGFEFADKNIDAPAETVEGLRSIKALAKLERLDVSIPVFIALRRFINREIDVATFLSLC